MLKLSFELIKLRGSIYLPRNNSFEKKFMNNSTVSVHIMINESSKYGSFWHFNVANLY